MPLVVAPVLQSAGTADQICTRKLSARPSHDVATVEDPTDRILLEIPALKFMTEPLSVSSQVPDKIDSLYTCPECANRAYCCIYVWIFTYYSVPWLIMVDERWLITTRFDRHMRLVGISPLDADRKSVV